jgi:hypothetical protein
MSTSPEDVANAQKAVDDAKKAVSSAESALIKQFGEGVVGVAKIYFNMHGGSAFNQAKALDLGADPSQKYMQSLQQAVDGISKTQEAQNKLTDAIGNLSATMAKKAEVESKEWSLNKETMRQRVNELEIDVKYYADLLVGVAKSVAKQTRIETTRKSYADGNLVYQFGVSDAIKGGSFTIKLGGTATGPITIAPPDASGNLDFVDIGNNINTAISAWPGSTAVALDQSPGYYTVTFANQPKELDLFIDEQKLLPAAEAKEPSVLPKEVSADDAEIQGMFTDILLKITESNDKSETDASAQATKSKWSVSLWFASASGDAGQSQGNSQQRSEFFSQEIEIGLRVAKVSFDRGGWFNPQIFKMTNAFTRLADILVSPGKTVDDIIANAKSQTELSNLFKVKDVNGKYVASYILPAFPVAMAIVKDVTIKVKTSHMTSEAAKSVVENASASSGGFLCFSVSTSSSSKNTSESSMHGAHGEYYYIRIPGPQILGYFLQMLPEDNAVMYKPATSADGKNEVLEAFKLYDRAPELLKASGELLKITSPVDRTNT